MRLSNIILRVADIGESVAFWRDLVGLDLSWSGDEFAFFAIGDNQLTLNQPLVFEDQASDTEIVFEAEDVHSAVSAMRERGVPFEVEPRAVTTDGERTLYAAHFRDPDGHVASVTGWVEGTQ
ncbi:MAG TPA: VOC family protein [Acidimicrobiia bacterium]|jgi:catechol 2,3-dioxygenase-like lactoylglutathione lyase family enzyme|nr:VOC family protein [Acidimicrobiia bacterium]